ncbi:MAG: class II aldolase/adducin family protein [Chloroflexi bacterium]|nr:class II aldolase/adducin family protein [Chloroflexota bacterium]
MDRAETIARLKHELALASRILDVSGATSAFGHISVRLPGEDAFLIPAARAAALVRPEDILVVGLDGRLREGEGVLFVETPIHAAAYRLRPEVQSVAHTHPEWAITVGLGDEPMYPVHMTACRYFDGVPVHPEGRMLTNAAMAETAIHAMAGRNAVLLKWHGAIVVGPTLHWTCLGAVLLEYNARLLARARQMGISPASFPREHALEMFAAYEGHEGSPAYHREWDYWVERVRRAQGGELFALHGEYQPVSPRNLRPD